ncbi:MAG: hypothetical protein OEQ29_08065 [Alphaproteobacteria bacterium]|nr:hypothetical protein [Alphaproteobacteria bacterium]
MNQTGKKVLIGTVVAVLLAAIVVGGLFVFYRVDLGTAPFYRATFDTERWRTAHRGKTSEVIGKKQAQCIRGAMYGELKNRSLRPGASRARVIELIGKPDFGSEGVKDGNKCQRWNLGFCSGFKIDLDSHNICFDKAGRVNHVFRLQH